MKYASILLALLTLTACTTDPATGKQVFDKAKAGRVVNALGDIALNDAGKIAIGALAGVVSSVASGDTNKADELRVKARHSNQRIILTHLSYK